MINVLTDRRMIQHRPPTGHPERPERLKAILDHWQSSEFQSWVNLLPCREVDANALLRVHSSSYLEDVETESLRASDEKPVMMDPDTYLGRSSFMAAKLASGAAVAAVDQVMNVGKESNRIFCAIRPPGHHARRQSAMGFCIYANIAVAAAHARDVLGLDRILIVDFDVHHGNGTQEIFYDDDRVGFLSIHRYPFYPGTGGRDETGTGRGLGYTWNIPLPADTKPVRYLEQFQKALHTAANKVKPQLVLISAGFDAHRLDPVGGLGLQSEDFHTITKMITEVADHYCDGRIVSLLEGGYNVEKLVESASIHLKCLETRKL
ncbi:MAG: hypothetical protein RJA81_1756 [Planctomycetota bacterium]